MLTRHADGIRRINQGSNQYYSQTMNGLNQTYINYMREQSPWINPDTGEVSTLPYGTPDTFYHRQGDQPDPTFYYSTGAVQ